MRVNKVTFMGLLLLTFLSGCGTNLHPKTRKRVSKQQEIVKRVAGAAEKHHMYDYAAFLYQKELQSRPNDFHTLKHISIDLTRSNQLRASIPYYHRALRLKSDDLILNMGLANSYLALGALHQAGFFYDKTLTIKNGRYSEAYDGFAVLLDQVGCYDQAMYCYQKSLAQDSGNINAQNNLAMSFALSGKWDDAMHQLKSLSTEHPSGKVSENIKLIKKLLRKYPNNLRKRSKALITSLYHHNKVDPEDRSMLLKYARKWCIGRGVGSLS